MKELTTATTLPRADADYEADFDQILTEIARLQDDMNERQSRLEQTQSETQSLLTRMEQQLIAN